MWLHYPLKNERANQSLKNAYQSCEEPEAPKPKNGKYVAIPKYGILFHQTSLI